MKKTIRALTLIGIVIAIALSFIPDWFSRLYIFFQIVVGVYAFYLLWKNNGWYTHTNTVASILTVIGVFGTFLGIFIGLQSFNIDKIDESIPDLLTGLRFAFLTSLVGIGSAILLRGVVSPLFQRKGKHPSETERERFFKALKDIETSGESNLLAQLKRLTKAVEEEGSETRGALVELQTNLTCGQSATTEELKKLTATVSKNVGEVAEKVGEIATGQLIKALKEVIRDFNKNLTEQFGENFKQLNEAVKKTVEWQEQYRQQMGKLANEFRIAAQSVEQSNKSLGEIAKSANEIADRSDSIVNCAEKLDPILHTLNDQLQAFSELHQKANDAFPLIEKRLDALTTKFSDTVQKAITDSQKSMEDQRDALKTQTDQLQQTVKATTENFNELTKDFSSAVKTSLDDSQKSMEEQRNELTKRFGELKTAMDDANQQLQKTTGDIKAQLDSVFEKSADHITKTTTDFTQYLTGKLEQILTDQSKELSNIVERNKEDMEKHVDLLHTALRKSLGESLDSLASHLESLSKGFVANYTELAQSYTAAVTELRQFVNAHDEMN